jgi:hypothetical protein
MFNSGLMRDPAFIGYAHECDEHYIKVTTFIKVYNATSSVSAAMMASGLNYDDLCVRDTNRIFNETGVDLSLSSG